MHELLVPTTGLSPVESYLARLSQGSWRAMRDSMYTICGMLTDSDSYNCYPWETVRYEDAQMIRAMLTKKYAPATVNKMLSALRGVLKECWRQGKMSIEEYHRAIDVAPVRGQRLPKGRTLHPIEIAALLICGPNGSSVKNSVIIRFLLETGARREEAAGLRFCDIKDPPAVVINGKGNKERMIPLTNELYGALSMFWQPGEHTPDSYVFGVSPVRIYQIVRQAARRAGIAPITPHDLRRTFASRCLGRGIDLVTVQKLMGHSDPRTTSNYDRRGPEVARAAIEKVWG